MWEITRDLNQQIFVNGFWICIMIWQLQPGKTGEFANLPAANSAPLPALSSYQ